LTTSETYSLFLEKIESLPAEFEFDKYEELESLSQEISDGPFLSAQESLALAQAINNASFNEDYWHPISSLLLEHSESFPYGSELFLIPSQNEEFEELKWMSLNFGSSLDIPSTGPSPFVAVSDKNISECWPTLHWQRLTVNEIRFILLCVGLYDTQADFTLSLSEKITGLVKTKLEGNKLTLKEISGMQLVLESPGSKTIIPKLIIEKSHQTLSEPFIITKNTLGDTLSSDMKPYWEGDAMAHNKRMNSMLGVSNRADLQLFLSNEPESNIEYYFSQFPLPKENRSWTRESFLQVLIDSYANSKFLTDLLIANITKDSATYGIKMLIEKEKFESTDKKLNSAIHSLGTTPSAEEISLLLGVPEEQTKKYF